MSGNPHIRYAEPDHRGYLVLDVQADKVQSDWYLIEGVDVDEGTEWLDASWAVYEGQNRVTEVDRAEEPNDETPGLAS